MKPQLFMAICGAACLALAALPAAAGNSTPAENQRAEVRQSWPAETLTGTISMVDPNQRILVVKDHDGVPFDIMIGRSTRIESGNHRLTLSDLSADVSQPVTVRFVPEGRGDVGRTVNLNG